MSNFSDLYRGKCEAYTGNACSKYIGNRKVYVDAFQNQEEMEKQITSALTLIGKLNLPFTHFIHI